MEWIVTRRRGGTTADPGPGQELTSSLRAQLPPRFEAVGEALATGSDPVAACEVLGGTLARDGVSVGEALEGLARTCEMVRGEAPAYAETRALVTAWGEATLGYLHAVSCADPLTGLATLAHLRTCLADRYRVGPVRETHALVVVVAPLGSAAEGLGEPLARAMQDAQLGATVGGVLTGPGPLALVAPGVVVVLVERDEELSRRVGLLQRMLADATPRPRVWVEGLPDAEESAVALLDELARS